MRRHNYRFEPIDLLELVRFGIRRTGHAGELAVHAEIILVSNRRQRLVLALNAHALLGLDSLM